MTKNNTMKNTICADSKEHLEYFQYCYESVGGWCKLCPQCNKIIDFEAPKAAYFYGSCSPSISVGMFCVCKRRVK